MLSHMFDPTLCYALAGIYLSEVPDLGAFTSVFREFQHFNTGPPRILHHNLSVDFEHEIGETLSRSDLLPTGTLPENSDSDAPPGSTVWNQGIIASYLLSHTPSALSQSTSADRPRVLVDSTTDCEIYHSLPDDSLEDGPPAVEKSESETEGEPDLPTLVVGSVDPDDIVDPNYPTLGTIDSVIEFLNSERHRIQAGRQAEVKTAHYSSPSDTGLHGSHDAEARRSRRRRRKKPLKPIQILKRVKDVLEAASETTTTHTEDTGGDADRDDAPVPDPDTSSSSESVPTHHKSTPSTPPRTKAASLVRDKLKHSRSTPALQVQTLPPDPQILKLRCLAHKLRLKFPEDYERITTLLTQDFSAVDSDFSDPRGPAPRPRDTLIHVFIDQLRFNS